MTPSTLLLLVCTATGVSLAVLLGVPAHPGRIRGAPRLLKTLQSAVRRGRRAGAGRAADELRSSAGALLHQYAALLQSGRSQSQAWTDLGAHWRSREAAHPLTQVCDLAASAEQAGLGAVVGLRRSLETLSAAHHPGAAPAGSVAASPATRSAAAASLSSAGATVVLREVLERLISIHALSQSTGAPLSELCRRAAASLEDSAALVAAVRTAAAGPRLTQFILAALPVGGIAMGVLMGADPFAMLFGSVLGWGCLAAGLGSLLVGWRWSSRMIRRVGRRG